MTSENKIIVGSIDTTKSIDPWRRDTGGMSRSALRLTIDGQVDVLQDDPGQSGTPEEYYHRRVLYATIDHIQDGDNGDEPDADAVREYLEGEEGQRLMNVVIDGWEIDWDGHNLVGTLTDEASEAWDELLNDIALLPRDGWQYWTCEEWFSDSRDIIAQEGLTKEMTQEERQVIADKLEAQANSDGVRLVDDVEMHLAYVINTYIEEEEETE